MDLDVKDSSLDTTKHSWCEVESGSQKHGIKTSEEWEGRVSTALQLPARELETEDLQQDTQSQDISSLGDSEIDPEEKYISCFMSCQQVSRTMPNSQCSLQTAMNKLNELEKMCEALQVEKSELISELEWLKIRMYHSN